MSVDISEKPSLLASLLAQESQELAGARNSGSPDGNFAGKLDTILAEDGQLQRSAPAGSQSLAEIFKLQMLHSTLALAGDQAGDAPSPPLFERQSATIKSLIKAYSANLPESGVQPALAGGPLQPLPELSAAPPQVMNPTPANQSAESGWLDPIINKASSRYGVEAGLIKAIIKAESNFNPNAVSHAGARGLMQLMPGTARGLGVSDSFDPEQNVMAGTRFLRDLLSRYNGDIDSTLAAYNWGPGNVDKRPDHLPRETRDYLVRVKQLYASNSA